MREWIHVLWTVAMVWGAGCDAAPDTDPAQPAPLVLELAEALPFDFPWGSAYWGMSPDEVRALYGERLVERAEETPRLFTPFALPGVPLGGTEMLARFRFSRKKGSLAEVSLLGEPGVDAEPLVDELNQRFGDPLFQSDTDATWGAAHVQVRFLVAHEGRPLVDFTPAPRVPDVNLAILACGRLHADDRRATNECARVQVEAARRFLALWIGSPSIACEAVPLREFRSCVEAHPRHGDDDRLKACGAWIQGPRADFVQALACFDSETSDPRSQPSSDGRKRGRRDQGS